MASGQDDYQYEKLGVKTLVILILRRAQLALFWILILIIGIIIASKFVPSPYFSLATKIIQGGIVLELFFISGAIVLGWLEYDKYKIYIGEENLKITKGLVSIEAIGIPCRRIEDVKIERNPFDQMLGMSTIIISLAGGQEAENGQEKNLEITLPFLDKNLAETMTNILLKKSEVQEISVENPNGISK